VHRRGHGNLSGRVHPLGKMSFLKKIFRHVNFSDRSAVETATKQSPLYLPTLWLLGKTGAGKSSLIQAVTGLSVAKVGDGFRPCTMTSRRYDFPLEKPLLRFLDTRGLAEADYDAREDIAACEKSTNALIVVMKAEDPEQSSVIHALKLIRKSGVIKHILLVHTGVLLLDRERERYQCIAHNQSQVESAWKGAVESVSVDFVLEDGSTMGVQALKSRLAEFLPILSLLGARKEHATAEENNFAKLRADILWYASASGGSDAIPVVGLGSVPVIQARMLHRLAIQYGVKWNKKTLAEFIAALGTGFSVQYLSKLGVRQLTKLIPVYGQTIGSATAFVISFCSTYAIGRAACKYFYHKSKGEPIPEAELRRMYQTAFSEIKKVGESEAQRH
jgi:uncharacterized protein (DUF697 family)